jgi:hypothetical protein
MVGQRWGDSQSGVNVVLVADAEAISHVDTNDLILVINNAGVGIEDPPATDVVHSVNCLTKGSEVTFANIVVKELGYAVSNASCGHNVVTAEEA